MGPHHDVTSVPRCRALAVTCVLAILLPVLILTQALEISCPDVVHSFAGQHARLVCSISLIDGQTGPSVTVFREASTDEELLSCSQPCSHAESQRFELDINVTSGEMVFSIQRAGSSDSGLYKCLVDTTISIKRVVMWLNITECYQPQPSVSCPSNVTTGARMSIRCSHDAPPRNDSHTAEYTVTRDGDPSVLGVLGSGDSSLLSVIATLNRNNFPGADAEGGLHVTFVCCRTATDLSCVPSGGLPLCSPDCKTMLVYPPDDVLFIWSPVLPWTEGDEGNVSVLCLANGYPPPTVTWRIRNDPGIMITSESHPGSSRMVFSEITRDLSGSYECEARMTPDDIDSLSAAVNLTVQYPPRIHQSGMSVHANEGSVATLRCAVDAYPPSTSITWTASNQSQSSIMTITEPQRTGTVRVKTLIIMNMERALFGNYTCTAFNAVGTQSVVFILEGHCYPDPPTDLRLLEYSSSSLGLAWTPGYDGGLDVTYTISFCSTRGPTDEITSCRTHVNIRGTRYTLNGLEEDTKYFIIIGAENDVGESRNQSQLVAFTSRSKGTHGSTADHELLVTVFVVIGSAIGLLVLLFICTVVVIRCHTRTRMRSHALVSWPHPQHRLPSQPLPSLPVQTVSQDATKTHNTDYADIANQESVPPPPNNLHIQEDVLLSPRATLNLPSTGAPGLGDPANMVPCPIPTDAQGYVPMRQVSEEEMSTYTTCLHRSTQEVQSEHLLDCTYRNQSVDCDISNLRSDTQPCTRCDDEPVPIPLEQSVENRSDTELNTKEDTGVDTELNNKEDTGVDTELNTKDDTGVDTKPTTKDDTGVDTKPTTKEDAGVDPDADMSGTTGHAAFDESAEPTVDPDRGK